MNISKSWTTVTPLSKTIALIIFAVFPALGFFAGARYQQKIDGPIINTQIPAQVTEKIVYQPLLDTKSWKTYSNAKIGMTLKYPSTWTLLTKHTMSNREIDNPQEINTAILSGKEGELTLRWGPMGYGGGCDNYKKVAIDGKTLDVCASLDEKGNEAWAPITNGSQDYEKANELRAVIKPPLESNRNTIFTIFSTIHYF